MGVSKRKGSSEEARLDEDAERKRVAQALIGAIKR